MNAPQDNATAPGPKKSGPPVPLLVIGAILLIGGIGLGGRMWWRSQHLVETDNAFIAGRIHEHAHSEVEPHALPHAESERVAIAAGLIAQDADGFMHARSLRVAHGVVTIRPATVPEQAEPVVVAGALGVELRLVAIIASVVAQDTDPAADVRAVAVRGALRPAQASAPSVDIGEARRRHMHAARQLGGDQARLHGLLRRVAHAKVGDERQRGEQVGQPKLHGGRLSGAASVRRRGAGRRVECRRSVVQIVPEPGVRRTTCHSFISSRTGHGVC